jgi:hypothetical protein
MGFAQVRVQCRVLVVFNLLVLLLEVHYNLSPQGETPCRSYDRLRGVKHKTTSGHTCTSQKIWT